MYTLWTMLLLAVLSMSFVSCEWDDDDEIAYTLEGTWKGNMYMSEKWNGEVYGATYSEICFVRDPYHYNSGTGYWVDFYDNYGWGRNYVANHIDWIVSGHTIKVDFLEERTTLRIDILTLSDNTFRGIIYDGDTRVDFRLTHTSSPNWNSYIWGYDDWGDYYSKENKMTRAADASSVETQKGEVQMPRRFVRSAK